MFGSGITSIETSDSDTAIKRTSWNGFPLKYKMEGYFRTKEMCKHILGLTGSQTKLVKPKRVTNPFL